MDVDSLLSDSKLDMLFAKLNINAHEKRELCVAFYEHFVSSTTPDIYLKKISDALSKIATEQMDQIKRTDVITEIITLLRAHAVVFYSNAKRLEKLEAESQMFNSLILSNEIASLYIEYFVKPVLYQVLGNASWDKFTNQLSDIEDTIDNDRLKAIEEGREIDDENLHRPITKFLEPLQNEIPISLTEVRFLRKDRADLAHIRHKTVSEQLSLIDKVKNFKFPQVFEHKDLVNNMVSALEKHKHHLHRCN